MKLRIFPLFAGVMTALFAGAAETENLTMRDVTASGAEDARSDPTGAEREPEAQQKKRPKPFPDFEAKRIRPPSSSTARRIMIQITPEPEPKPIYREDLKRPDRKPDAKPILAPSNPGSYTWFWDRISPGMATTGPGRLLDAISVLNTSGNVSAPRLQALQEIARVQGVPILKSTVGTDVSPALVLAMIAVESAGRSDAVSPAGAEGLMQLMPDTATRFGVKDSFKPDENILGGVKYLDWLMREFNSDPILVLAGYNAGEGAVKTHQGVPPYAETRDYVPKVLAAFQVASALCRTPPQLITDGCVFVSMN